MLCLYVALWALVPASCGILRLSFIRTYTSAGDVAMIHFSTGSLSSFLAPRALN